MLSGKYINKISNKNQQKVLKQSSPVIKSKKYCMQNIKKSWCKLGVSFDFCPL
jgi:hypothetical protein